MNEPVLHILLVEDNLADQRLLRESLAEAASQVQIVAVEDLTAALAHLEKTGFDAMLLDLSLPDSHGIETIDRALAAAPHCLAAAAE